MDASKNDAPLNFRLATTADAETVTRLVNSAYRGESSKAGWTTEADLIIGDRILLADIETHLAEPETRLLLCEQAEKIIGSVLLKNTDEGAYLGMFVVQPNLQGQGIGKLFMQHIDSFVQQEWGVNKIWMTVITVRDELLAYYERRGYRRTGKYQSFPKDAGASTPVVDGLQMEILEKELTPIG